MISGEKDDEKGSQLVIDLNEANRDVNSKNYKLFCNTSSINPNSESDTSALSNKDSTAPTSKITCSNLVTSPTPHILEGKPLFAFPLPGKKRSYHASTLQDTSGISAKYNQQRSNNNDSSEILDIVKESHFIDAGTKNNNISSNAAPNYEFDLVPDKNYGVISPLNKLPEEGIFFNSTTTKGTINGNTSLKKGSNTSKSFSKWSDLKIITNLNENSASIQSANQDPAGSDTKSFHDIRAINTLSQSNNYSSSINIFNDGSSKKGQKLLRNSSFVFNSGPASSPMIYGNQRGIQTAKSIYDSAPNESIQEQCFYIPGIKSNTITNGSIEKVKSSALYSARIGSAQFSRVAQNDFTGIQQGNIYDHQMQDGAISEATSSSNTFHNQCTSNQIFQCPTKKYAYKSIIPSAARVAKDKSHSLLKETYNGIECLFAMDKKTASLNQSANQNGSMSALTSKNNSFTQEPLAELSLHTVSSANGFHNQKQQHNSNSAQLVNSSYERKSQGDLYSGHGVPMSLANTSSTNTSTSNNASYNNIEFGQKYGKLSQENMEVKTPKEPRLVVTSDINGRLSFEDAGNDRKGIPTYDKAISIYENIPNVSAEDYVEKNVPYLKSFTDSAENNTLHSSKDNMEFKGINNNWVNTQTRVQVPSGQTTANIGPSLICNNSKKETQIGSNRAMGRTAIKKKPKKEYRLNKYVDRSVLFFKNFKCTPVTLLWVTSMFLLSIDIITVSLKKYYIFYNYGTDKIESEKIAKMLSSHIFRKEILIFLEYFTSFGFLCFTFNFFMFLFFTVTISL